MKNIIIKNAASNPDIVLDVLNRLGIVPLKSFKKEEFKKYQDIIVWGYNLRYDNLRINLRYVNSEFIFDLEKFSNE